MYCVDDLSVDLSPVHCIALYTSQIDVVISTVLWKHYFGKLQVILVLCRELEDM